MPIKRVDFDVLTFITSLNNTPFTISDLLDAYLASPNCQHDNQKASRQYLYRNLRKYEDQGLVVSNGSKDSKALLYSLSNKPIAGTIIENSENESGFEVPECSSQDMSDRIRAKLKRHKLSLLKSIGVTEAFKEWVEEMPSERHEIQAQYNSARDESSKLLGKVSAYESLLVMYQGR
jgi:Fe2+ or Zn2+ uptake regulation protein